MSSRLSGQIDILVQVRVTGLEPVASRISVERAAIAPYPHKLPARFERAASALEVRHSVRLSYGSDATIRSRIGTASLGGKYASVTPWRQMRLWGVGPLELLS